MKNIGRIFSTFIFSMLFWVLFVLQDINIVNLDKEELIAGIIVSFVVALFTHKFFINKDPFWMFHPKRFFSLLAFIPIYAIELFKANLDVAKRALSKELNINPGIVKIQTELQSDYGLSMLANCITLTPGTITMDVVEKGGKNYMYIHCIAVPTEDIQEASKAIKGAFEPWVRRVFL